MPEDLMLKTIKLIVVLVLNGDPVTAGVANGLVIGVFVASIEFIFHGANIGSMMFFT